MKNLNLTNLVDRNERLTFDVGNVEPGRRSILRRGGQVAIDSLQQAGRRLPGVRMRRVERLPAKKTMQRVAHIERNRRVCPPGRPAALPLSLSRPSAAAGHARLGDFRAERENRSRTAPGWNFTRALLPAARPPAIEVGVAGQTQSDWDATHVPSVSSRGAFERGKMPRTTE